jgi:hypothetical protein
MEGNLAPRGLRGTQQYLWRDLSYDRSIDVFSIATLRLSHGGV